MRSQPQFMFAIIYKYVCKIFATYYNCFEDLYYAARGFNLNFDQQFFNLSNLQYVILFLLGLFCIVYLRQYHFASPMTLIYHYNTVQLLMLVLVKGIEKPICSSLATLVQKYGPKLAVMDHNTYYPHSFLSNGHTQTDSCICHEPSSFPAWIRYCFRWRRHCIELESIFKIIDQFLYW